MEQKLKDIMDSYQNEEIYSELWGPTTESPDNIKMQIDTINKVINVESSSQDAQGKPLLEWSMDATTGKVK